MQEGQDDLSIKQFDLIGLMECAIQKQHKMSIFWVHVNTKYTIFWATDGKHKGAHL